ncbi:hypothetical protein BC834DRAFT_846112 [Gloeopeniophorella convolvens]|nr:hypothetical protein BC834DRAFT_846112 [Gloeopeniophorella convolvens]
MSGTSYASRDVEGGASGATVAAFTLETYKILKPDSGDTAVLLLNQISEQLAALSNNTPLPAPIILPGVTTPFRPSSSAIRINILCFLSLTLSLTCALASTLLQQWARRYLRLAHDQVAPQKRARIRTYLFNGVQAFRMQQVAEALPVLLHVAVFLFFAGLIELLFSINDTVAHVILPVVAILAGTYLVLTILPIALPNCPYRTPFSAILSKLLRLLLYTPVSAIFVLTQLIFHDMVSKIGARLVIFVDHVFRTVEEVVSDLGPEMDRRMLERILLTVDNDNDIEAFVQGIPGFLRSGVIANEKTLVEGLLYDQHPVPLGWHLSHLLGTCSSGSRDLPEAIRRRRALNTLDTLRCLTSTLTHSLTKHTMGPMTWTFNNRLQKDADPAVAINAICTGGLAARVWLHANFNKEIFDPGVHLRVFVEAPWPLHAICSVETCNFMILYGVLKEVIPRLRNGSGASPDNLTPLWEVLPLLLTDIVPLTAEPRVRKGFLAVWDELLDLSGVGPSLGTRGLGATSDALSSPAPQDRLSSGMTRNILSLVEALLPIVDTLVTIPVDVRATPTPPTPSLDDLSQADGDSADEVGRASYVPADIGIRGSR